MTSKIRMMLKKHLADRDDTTPQHDVNEKKKKAKRK